MPHKRLNRAEGSFLESLVEKEENTTKLHLFLDSKPEIKQFFLEDQIKYLKAELLKINRDINELEENLQLAIKFSEEQEAKSYQELLEGALKDQKLLEKRLHLHQIRYFFRNEIESISDLGNSQLNIFKDLQIFTNSLVSFQTLDSADPIDYRNENLDEALNHFYEASTRNITGVDQILETQIELEENISAKLDEFGSQTAPIAKAKPIKLRKNLSEKEKEEISVSCQELVDFIFSLKNIDKSNQTGFNLNLKLTSLVLELESLVISSVEEDFNQNRTLNASKKILQAQKIIFQKLEDLKTNLNSSHASQLVIIDELQGYFKNKFSLSNILSGQSINTVSEVLTKISEAFSDLLTVPTPKPKKLTFEEKTEQKIAQFKTKFAEVSSSIERQLLKISYDYDQSENNFGFSLEDFYLAFMKYRKIVDKNVFSHSGEYSVVLCILRLVNWQNGAAAFTQEPGVNNYRQLTRVNIVDQGYFNLCGIRFQSPCEPRFIFYEETENGNISINLIRVFLKKSDADNRKYRADELKSNLVRALAIYK